MYLHMFDHRNSHWVVVVVVVVVVVGCEVDIVVVVVVVVVGTMEAIMGPKSRGYPKQENWDPKSCAENCWR